MSAVSPRRASSHWKRLRLLDVAQKVAGPHKDALLAALQPLDGVSFWAGWRSQ